MPSLAIDGRTKPDFYGALYKSYRERNRAFGDRQQRNWRMYSGVNFGQWHDQALRQLIDEKRAPHQVNFVQNKINTLTGNFLQNPFETKYETEMGTDNDWSIILNKLYLADKERTNWNRAKRKMLQAGMILRGVSEMYIDYTHDDLGAIGLRYINPFKVEFDPDWDTENINDNRFIIQDTWMTPDQIKRSYKAKGSEIDTAIEMYNQSMTNQFEDKRHDLIADRSPDYYDVQNNRYLVIQTMSLEYRDVSRVFDMEKSEFLPEDIDSDVLRGMMAVRRNNFKIVKREKAIVKVNTICPAISRTLVLVDNEDHPLQIGRYPIFTFSALNLHGEVQGYVDVLADLQEIYNKRESTFTHWQTTAHNGAEFVEEDFFADGAELNKYKTSKNKPGETYITNPGKISQSKPGIMNRPRGDAPNDLHTSADRVFNMSDVVSATPPAISGGEGKSGESGRLFEAKLTQAQTSLEMVSQAIQDLEHEIGEAYFYAVKQVYSGAPRQIRLPGQETVVLNVPTMQGIVNSVAEMPKMGVIVSQGRKGVSVKRELLNKFMDLRGIVQNPILQSAIEKQIIETLPNVPEKEIDAMKEKADVFEQLQFLRVQSESSQLMQALQQIGQQLQQLGGGGPQQLAQGPSAPGQTPLEGGGISVEGSDIAPEGGVPVDVNNINQLQ